MSRRLPRDVELDLPRDADKRRAVEAMFDRIAPRYDGLNSLITVGLHRRWKRAAIDALDATPGSRVIDLACGTGDLLFELGRRGVRGVGVDVSAGMLCSPEAVASAEVSAVALALSSSSSPPHDAAINAAVATNATRPTERRVRSCRPIAYPLDVSYP